MDKNNRSDGSILRNYRERLKGVMFSGISSFGFMLIISGSVLLTENRYGRPTLAETFMFVLGAIIAFGIIAIISIGTVGKPIVVEDIKGQELLWGLLQVLSLFGALAIAYIASLHVPRLFGFALISGLATLIHSLVLGLAFIFSETGRAEPRAKASGKLLPFVRKRFRKS